MFATLLTPLLTSVAMNTIGRVIPEVLNVGRMFASKRLTGAPYVPVEQEQMTLKGTRTTLLAVIFIAMKGAEWMGYWQVPGEAYDIVAQLMVGSVALKVT